MRHSISLPRVRALCRDFCAARDGNVAVIFTLALLPIIGLVGAAIDYGRAASARSALQAAADATSLALAQTANDLTPDQLQTKAQSYLEAQFHSADARGLQVTTAFDDSDGSTLTVSAHASVDNVFMRIMGFQTTGIGATAVSAWGRVKLRVSLVLDNTGSMASAGKMDALKRASHDLLDMLENAASRKGDVQAALVPFAKDVNVGRGKSASSWIDWSDWEAANGNNQLSCTGRGWHRTCQQQWVPADHSTWNGCITDRNQDYDTRNTTPTSAATRFPAEQYDSCPAAIAPLTDDFSALGRAVDDMQPAGNTNQTIGLAWGWQTLTEGDPLNPPPLKPDVSQAIILLTDGLNTENRWSTWQSQVDDRTRLACSNAKAAGVKIYTVLVMAGNSSLLQDCASDPSNYFALNSSNEISGAFLQIGRELTQLRIAR